MSTLSELTLSLGEHQLLKLTNESPELRLRALQQVQTSFIRCLQNGERINFKPVLLLKQLIRWFGYTPLESPESVLTLMLKLLRSDYVDAIVHKIPVQRLLTALHKIRKILECVQSKRSMDLLDEIQSLVHVKYNDSRPVDSNLTSGESECSSCEVGVFSIEKYNLQPADYEPAWSRASVDDLATMEIFVDSITIDIDLELLANLTNLQIRLCDYPIEYLLQPPHIFLHLLNIQMQQKRPDEVLLHTNRSLLSVVKLFQRRLNVRSKTLNYSASIESQELSPQQLRIPSALSLLLDACLRLLGPPELEQCRHNWHIIELIVEVIGTFRQISAPIPDHLMEGLGILVCKLLDYGTQFNNLTMPNSNLTKSLRIPRLHTLIFNGLLLDVISLNVQIDSSIDKLTTQALLQPIITDTAYLSCVPMRMQELSNLCDLLNNGTQARNEKKQLLRLKLAYSTALKQLVDKTRYSPMKLLMEQRQVCLVLIQLGSEKLLKQLCQAIVKCTSFYGVQPELRNEAESLLSTLFTLPDERLRSNALRMLKQPVVEHFHSFMDNTNYLTGCKNIELAKQHILGLPMSTQLLRQLLTHGWMTPHQHQHLSKDAQLLLQQWCIDYLIMLLGLAKLVDIKDFHVIFKLVLPVLPMIVCRAINYPQLEHLLLELLDPDVNYLDPLEALRANACYLFHPDAKVRKEAHKRVAYALILQDRQNIYKQIPDQVCLDLMGPNLCVVQPAFSYFKLFSDRMNLPLNLRSLQSLIRLLETPDLKPAICKSTLTQLNFLLHSWQAVEALINCEGSLNICLKLLRNQLLRNKNRTEMGSENIDLLQLLVWILLKLLFRSKQLRDESTNNNNLLVYLLRCLYIDPLDLKICPQISICIFQLLFNDHMTPTEDNLFLDVDLSPIMVPVTYDIDHRVSSTPATEGIALQDQLLVKHFDGNEALAAQHWRLYVAYKICGSPEHMQLSIQALQDLDIIEALKLKPADLSLVQASLVDVQLKNHLEETGNCSNHGVLHKYVASIQIFLLLSDPYPFPDGCLNLWKFMHKYLRITPGSGNEADLQLYMTILELCTNCLRRGLASVSIGLNTALETDPHHSFFVILRDLKISLHLLNLLTACFVQLLSKKNYQGDFSWYGKLFTELSSLARTHFEERNLQHVRCLLRILSKLSEHPLELPDNKLQTYYQHFVQLSSNLRTSTQTGAQWQRDCLLVICQLQEQSQSQSQLVKNGGSSKVLRYLLGLCGHTDGKVRTLAWVSLSTWIKGNSETESMSVILLELINVVPGGLPACCLISMLDVHEQMLVRVMAGRVFELLIPHIGAAACCDMLRNHSFLKEANKSLGALQTYPILKLNRQKLGTQNSCEIIGCYVSICVKLVLMEPTWCTVLCEHAFINSLGDVIKLRTPDNPHQKPYVELCAGQICKLYALCYQVNFNFLERSICRDSALLKSFIALIGDVLNQDKRCDNQLVQVLKLLMVLCKDQNAYEFLCEQFQDHPDMLLDLLCIGLSSDYMHQELQRYTLATLSLLLIKAQTEKEEHNLLKVLESIVVDSNPIEMVNDKENTPKGLNNQLKTSLKSREGKEKATSVERSNGAVFLFHSLVQLFDLHYPEKTFSFLRPSTKSHLQICEVLGNLLKESPSAVDTASNFLMLEHVIHLLETFLSDDSVGNATVYVRRVGAHKSRDIINNLLVLLNMMMKWHNSPQAVITDSVMASRVVRVLLRLWPWLSHSGILKHMTVRLITILTEHSFEMCRQTSQVLPNHSSSLLQLVVRVADQETTKKEQPGLKNTSNLKCDSKSIIQAALRVMINCCSCAEGRLSLGKMRVLDMFDTIFPATSSNVNKLTADALLSWLSFWEIFSRYDIGNKVCHMTALLNMIRRSPPLNRMRMCCLRILRNMSFCNNNRMQLVGMTEFINFLREILCQPVQGVSGGGDTSLDSFEEHSLAALCLWKLFGFSAKCRALLRGSKLFKQLSVLSEQLAIMETERPHHYKTVPFAIDLSRILGYILKALN